MTYDYSNNTVYFNPTSSPTCCVGGLAGEAYSGGSIQNSYSRSNIIMTYNVYNQGAAGGLYGNDYTSSTKAYLYSTGSITMVSGSLPSSVGGLAGSNYTTTSNSYWDTQTSGLATSSGGSGVVGKTTAQMKTQSTFSGWDFSTIWAIDSNGVINNGYPYLQWSVTDSTAPTITNVSSDKSNGNFTTGEVIDIDVTFSETVTSTGNVTVTLETGSTDRTCTFTVTGATSGTCNYTVQAGDTTSDLTVSSISGTIADASANAMTNFVPTTNLATNKALVIDTTAPTTPGTPSTTTPSSTTAPVWSWTASTDGGTGLATTAYTVQWSQSSGFSSGVSASTSTTNSFTQPSALTDGTWYFRVNATDVIGNISAYSSAGSITIDTFVPPAPAEDIPEIEDIPITNLETTSEGTTEEPEIVTSSIAVILNDFPSYTSGEGKQLALCSNQVVKFKVESETHSATVQEVGADYAILLLQSEPMTVYLGVGQTSRYDVNRDGQDDISITLNGITNGVANLVFAQLGQPKPAASQDSDGLSWLTYMWSILVLMIVALITRTLLRAGHKSKPVG